MRQLLIKRMAVRCPSVLPKLFAMIGDNHNQSVIDNSELLQLADKLFQARVVVQNLAVVAVHGSADETVRVNPGLPGTGAADHCSTSVLDLSTEALVVAIKFRRLGRIRKFLL